MKSVVFFSRTGCFLPLLIILNLFFGWMVFKPLEWLAVGGVLVLLFILNSMVVARSVFSHDSFRNSAVIDVEGQVLEGDKKSRIEHRKS